MFWCLLLWFFALTVLLYVFNRLTCGITNSVTCLVGKTAIITGGNSGIGLQIAKILASRGCRVIIADKDDSEKSRLKIIEETDNPNIATKHLDLSSFQSVRSFVEDIKRTENKLDILINNAGVGKANISDEELDPVMQINYYSPFLLTHLLIGLLQKSAPSRIIFTSSSMAFTHNLTLEDLTNSKKIFFNRLLTMIFRYGNSKLATLIASNEIASRLKGTGVTCNSLHPGACRTNIFKSLVNFVLTKYYVELWNLVTAKTQWEAAQTTVHLATSKEVKNVTGKYFWDCKEFLTPPLAKDKEFCLKWFEHSEKLVGLEDTERLKK